MAVVRESLRRAAALELGDLGVERAASRITRNTGAVRGSPSAQKAASPAMISRGSSVRSARSRMKVATGVVACAPAAAKSSTRDSRSRLAPTEL